MHIKVERAFCIGGVRQEIGTVLEVPERFGRELIVGAKAQAVEAPPAVAPEEPEPEQPETKAAPRRKRA